MILHVTRTLGPHHRVPPHRQYSQKNDAAFFLIGNMNKYGLAILSFMLASVWPLYSSDRLSDIPHSPYWIHAHLNADSLGPLLIGFLLGMLTLFAILCVLIAVLFLQKPLQHTPARRSPLKSMARGPFSHEHCIDLIRSPPKSKSNLFASVESAEWLNRLVMTLSRRMFSDSAPQSIQNALESMDTPEWMSPLHVLECDLGSIMPNVQNINSWFVEEDPDCSLRINANMALKLRASITCSLELVLNWPFPSLASLPLTICMSNIEITGKAHGRLPTRSDGTDGWIICPEPPKLDMHLMVVAGADYKLEDVRKIKEVLVRKLSQYIVDHIVHPNYYTLSCDSFMMGARSLTSVPHEQIGPL